ALLERGGGAHDRARNFCAGGGREAELLAARVPRRERGLLVAVERPRSDHLHLRELLESGRARPVAVAHGEAEGMRGRLLHVDARVEQTVVRKRFERGSQRVVRLRGVLGAVLDRLGLVGGLAPHIPNTLPAGAPVVNAAPNGVRSGAVHCRRRDGPRSPDPLRSLPDGQRFGSDPTRRLPQGRLASPRATPALPGRRRTGAAPIPALAGERSRGTEATAALAGRRRTGGDAIPALARRPPSGTE